MSMSVDIDTDIEAEQTQKHIVAFSTLVRLHGD